MVVTRSKGASMDKDGNADDPPGHPETIGNGLETQAPPGMTGGEQATLLPTVANESEAVTLKRMELRMKELELESEKIALRRVELQSSTSRPPSTGSEGSDRRQASLDPVAQCSKVLKGYQKPRDPLFVFPCTTIVHVRILSSSSDFGARAYARDYLPAKINADVASCLRERASHPRKCVCNKRLRRYS